MSPDQTVQLITLNLTQHDRLRRSRHGSLRSTRSFIIARLGPRLSSSKAQFQPTKAGPRWVSHFRRCELVIIVRDVQHLAARLAVDGVRLVPLQPTLGAREEHLAAGAEDSLRQA